MRFINLCFLASSNFHARWTIYSLQEMRLSDVLFLFSASPIASRFSEHLGILDSRSFVPSRACRKGFESFSAISLSRFHVRVHPTHQAPNPSIHHSSPLAIYHTTFHPNPHTHHNNALHPLHDQPLCLCLGFLLSVALALVFSF